MPQLILICSLALGCWLIRRDTAQRTGISGTLWIPTIWLGVIASRPVSMWLGGGGGINTLDGSPLDRLFFLGMIVASLLILIRRNVGLGGLIAANWPVLLFYSFLLLSVLWANSPLASFKRWFKEVGNIAVILLLLTETKPLNAIRTVFVRCAYLLIPLSVVLIRYFPNIGRNYNIHSGAMEATGVTCQKNSLGSMLLVCGLVVFWDWIERSRLEVPRRGLIDRVLPFAILGTAVYLLLLCDSKTSLVCLCLGAFIISALRLPLLSRRIKALGVYFCAGAFLFLAVDSQFGIISHIVSGLGRDMTFTGRTDVWRELLAVNTDPIAGTGFMSFWDDMHYRQLLPEWVAFSAHNGYLEVYLAGGFVGLTILGIMLLATGARINAALAWDAEYGLVRFAFYVVALVANFSETNFACMTPVGFLFLIAAIGYAQPMQQLQGRRDLPHSPAYGHSPVLHS